MPIITFTEDVTLESEAPETGPHYRKGYAPDVSEKEAQKWVSKGVAVYGAIEAPAEAVEAPPEPEPEAVSAPEPRPSRRKRGWSPLDEDSTD